MKKTGEDVNDVLDRVLEIGIKGMKGIKVSEKKRVAGESEEA